MNSSKNVLFGKIGKSIKFKNLKKETGETSVPIFLSSISRMLPNYQFYVPGASELSKLTSDEYLYLFPNKNVHDVFSINRKGDTVEDIYGGIIKNLQNIKIDFALMFNGICSSVNISKFLKKDDGDYFHPLNSYKWYTAPYLYVLNELGCPLYLMSEDARYVSINAMDLFNRERLILTQFNGEVESYKHIISKDDIYHKNVKKSTISCVYSDIEKIFLMGIDRDWRNKIDIHRKLNNNGNHCIVLSNGCGTNKLNTPGDNHSRLPVYVKYIYEGLKGTKFENTKVYGLWDADIYEKYDFIVKKMMVDLEDEISDAKYSLVYSQVPGFVTIKPYELIIKGIIPFIHPDYDKDRLLGLSNYLYINDPDDFVKKMEELDSNDDLYVKILNECFDLIKDEFLDGTYIINKIMSIIIKNLYNKDWVNENGGIESLFDHYSRNIIKYI